MNAIPWAIAVIAFAAVSWIIYEMAVAPAADEDEIPVPDVVRVLHVKLTDEELAIYLDAVDRVRHARGEIYGMHIRKSREIGMKPWEITIGTSGKIYRA